MNKKTTVAFEFFDSMESNLKYNFEEIVTSFSAEKQKKKNLERYIYYRKIRKEIVRYFDYLYGIKQTFPFFIEWGVKCKKMNIPNNSIFRYHDIEWMKQQGISWTEILSREGVSKPIKWVYKDNQLVEIDYQINSDCNVGI